MLKHTYYNTKYGRHDFRYTSPRLWNQLPQELRKEDSINTFKKKLKTLLFQHTGEIINGITMYREQFPHIVETITNDLTGNNLYMWICIYECMCMCIYAYVYICVYVYAYVCVMCIYVYLLAECYAECLYQYLWMSSDVLMYEM